MSANSPDEKRMLTMIAELKQRLRDRVRHVVGDNAAKIEQMLLAVATEQLFQWAKKQPGRPRDNIAAKLNEYWRKRDIQIQVVPTDDPDTPFRLVSAHNTGETKDRG